MPTEDRRRVRTAVTGHPKSHDPAYMPTDTAEAEEFRDQARESGDTHWCGLLLGGCGGRLSLKIPEEKIPHFAHHGGEANQCARMLKGREDIRGSRSADHLYAHRQLRQWMRDHEQRGEAAQAPPTFVGLEAGHGCTELIVPTGGKPLRLVFTHVLDHDLFDLARSPAARDYVWLVRANLSVTRGLVSQSVPYRLFQIDVDIHGTRTLQVGFRDGAGDVQWVPLSDCVLRGDSLERLHAFQPYSPPPRPESAPITAAPSPLEQAMGSLRTVLGQDDITNLRAMIRQVHIRMTGADARGLPAYLLAEARELVREATQVLPTREPVRVQPSNVALARQGPDKRTSESRANIRRDVDKHLGKLLWAQERGLTRVYDDNRAALVRLLNHPATPSDACDRIKQQLRTSPKGLFDHAAPQTAPRQPAPEPRASRGRSTRSARRKEQDRWQVLELLDTLRWAQRRQVPSAYRDSRQQLVQLLDRSDTSHEMREKIRAQLQHSPEDFFDRPSSQPEPESAPSRQAPREHRPSRRNQRAPEPDAMPKNEQQPSSHRGRPEPAPDAPRPRTRKQPSHRKRSERRGRDDHSAHRRRRDGASQTASDGGLLANARIDERSRALLEQMRQAQPDQTRPEQPTG